MRGKRLVDDVVECFARCNALESEVADYRTRLAGVRNTLMIISDLMENQMRATDCLARIRELIDRELD